MDKYNNLAKIDYVQHRYRMFLAWKRERRLKALLLASNVLWLIIFAATR